MSALAAQGERITSGFRHRWNMPAAIVPSGSHRACELFTFVRFSAIFSMPRCQIADHRLAVHHVFANRGSHQASAQHSVHRWGDGGRKVDPPSASVRVSSCVMGPRNCWRNAGILGRNPWFQSFESRSSFWPSVDRGFCRGLRRWACPLRPPLPTADRCHRWRRRPTAPCC